LSKACNCVVDDDDDDDVAPPVALLDRSYSPSFLVIIDEAIVSADKTNPHAIIATDQSLLQ